MINFIYGRAGSGKSSRICELAAAAVREGRRVFVIVPEQMALEAEARMTELIGDAPTLSLEVLNFRRLCNRIFREYGGLSYSYATKSGQMLLMWRELSELAPMLKSGIAADKSTASEMLSAISEFKAYCITPRALEKAAEAISVDGENTRLADKLYDLSLVFAAYSNLLSQIADDVSDDLTKAADLLAEHDFFAGADVYLDSFYGFTPQEYRVIEALFRGADSVTLSLCLDASDATFENQARTAEYLYELAKRAGKDIHEETLTENHRAGSAELRFIEKNLWSLDAVEKAVFEEDAPALSLVECGSLFAECEAVATDICRRVREGAKWRDFAIVTRGIDRYDGILDVILEKYGVPHFVSRRVDIKNKPLIRLILLALTLISTNFRTEDMVSYIKTGLCGITPDEVCTLENYAGAWGIRGFSRWNEDFTMNPDGYTAAFSEKSARVLDTVNDVRERIMIPLADLREALFSAKTARDYSGALYNYLMVLKIPEKLDAIAAEKRTTAPAEAKEYEQLWGVLIDALDELTALMPDLEVDSTTFIELLGLIFDTTDIGRIPSTVDEVVSGDATLLRATAKHVYVIGANEGVFPLAPMDEGIFRDFERDILAGVGVALAPTTDYRAADERFAFYRAMTSASETVTVVWSSSDLAGAAQKPSLVVLRLTSLFPKLKITRFSSEPIEKRLEGRGNLLEFAAEADGTPLGAAIMEYIKGDEELCARAGRISVPLSNDDEVLTEETAKRLFGGDLALTQSRLDAYVLCHFSYFCKYVLKLDEMKKATFSAADIGTFVHHILEAFVSRAEREGTLANITDDELETMVDKIVSDYMQTICRVAPNFSGSRLAHLFERLRRSSRILCKNLAAEFSQSRFRPAFFELPIRFPSPDEATVEPLSVKLSDGTSAYVYGVADRVDVLQTEDKYYVRIVDYKTGSKEFSLENVSMGLDMQMLLYLFSIWKNGHSPRSALKIPDNAEIIPAGILYFSAGVPTVTLESAAEPSAVEGMVSDKLSRKGLLLEDENVLRAMDTELSGKYLPVKIKKDGAFSSSASLTSLEGFKTLLSSIEDTVGRIGEEIKRGNASAKPIQDKKHDACKYCAMRPVCRKQRKAGE